MKKLIQICSILCLALAFTIISANAQSTKKVKADIPFDFNVGGKHYSAGKYTLKISDSRTTALVYLTDSENNILDTMLVSVAGEAASGSPELVFNNYDGQRFLSKIAITDRSYKITRTSVERQVAAGKKAAEKKPVIVAIASVN